MAGPRGTSNRLRGGFSWVWAWIWFQGLFCLAVGGFYLWEREQRERAWRVYFAEQAAIEAGRQPIFARGEFPEVYDFCRTLWRDELHVHHEPAALAWTRTSLEGYFVEGAGATGLRRLRCTAKGVERGPRVARPLLENLPLEENSALDELAKENWSLAIAELARTPLDGPELAVEVVQHPGTGDVIRRRWSGIEAMGPRVEPPDAPPFPSLISDAASRPSGPQSLPPVAQLAPTSWVEKPDAAFDLVVPLIPKGAGIVEFSFSATTIEVAIEAPTKAPDGSGTYAYGWLSFDEYGVANADDWLASTHPPIFGCDKGRSPGLVRHDFHEAWAQRGKVPFVRAWYSCSSAYTDEIRGGWAINVE